MGLDWKVRMGVNISVYSFWDVEMIYHDFSATFDVEGSQCVNRARCTATAALLQKFQVHSMTAGGGMVCGAARCMPTLHFP